MCKFRHSVLFIIFIFTSVLANTEPTEDYRQTIYYPYHAAPYYSYPYTTGYGYIYNQPIVNAEYLHNNNDQNIVVYPDGPYEYDNYYKTGTSYCYLIANQIVCQDY